MTSLAHDITGSGSPLVLLHPVGLDRTFWRPVGERLAARHRVIAVDLRGHGETAWAPGAETVDDYAGDVHDLLAALDVGKAAVVGLSFGGMIAQSLAIRHPGDVSALVVAGCTAGFPAEARPAIAARGEAAEAGGMEAVVEPTLARWFTDAFREGGGDAPIRARLLANDVRAWANAWRAISRLDNAPHLSRILVSSLAIAGAADQACPVAALENLANAIPDGRLAVLPDAPHMMHIEQPVAFADAVLTFLAGQRRRD
jgi:3-oxoadipate enol-lactonase